MKTICTDSTDEFWTHTNEKTTQNIHARDVQFNREKKIRRKKTHTGRMKTTTVSSMCGKNSERKKNKYTIESICLFFFEMYSDDWIEIGLHWHYYASHQISYSLKNRYKKNHLIGELTILNFQPKIHCWTAINNMI